MHIGVLNRGIVEDELVFIDLSPTEAESRAAILVGSRGGGESLL